MNPCWAGVEDADAMRDRTGALSARMSQCPLQVREVVTRQQTVGRIVDVSRCLTACQLSELRVGLDGDGGRGLMNERTASVGLGSAGQRQKSGDGNEVK